jgi:hypothetical protein
VSLGPKPGEVVVVCDQQNNPPESSGVIEFRIALHLPLDYSITWRASNRRRRASNPESGELSRITLLRARASSNSAAFTPRLLDHLDYSITWRASNRREPVLVLAEQLELANERAERAERESAYFAAMLQAVAERGKLDEDAVAEIRAKVRAAHEAEAEPS